LRNEFEVAIETGTGLKKKLEDTMLKMQNTRM
jgi:hypothetical protein